MNRIMQEKADVEIKLLDKECWYGGIVRHFYDQPYRNKNLKEVMRGNIHGNQAAPLLLSSRGRYIWSDKVFNYEFRDGLLIIEGETASLVIDSAGDDLRSAYLKASRDHFPSSGRIPDLSCFTVPQYNSWIEVQKDPDQQKILKYSEQVLETGNKPGIMMIDDFWYVSNGDWKFDRNKFPDPKGMIDRLHDMGFKVMLWISPYITADSRNFDLLRRAGYLITTSDGKPSICEWWNGYSAALDLSNPEAFKWLQDQLDLLISEYGVDGFKFDGGDTMRYQGNTVNQGKVSANTMTEMFGRVGLKYDLSEYRACWKLGGQHLVQRVRDKAHDWEVGGLADLIPSGVLQGLLGYPYTCPDMIGGGEVVSFEHPDSSVNQELYCRWMQCSVFFPIIQFSALPENVLDKEHLGYVYKMKELRDSIADEMIAMVKKAAVDGEPIIRMMEYSFPGQGYEEVWDQFMAGDKYLVAPVLKAGVTEREVRIPPGKWQAEDGRVYEGPQAVTVKAPLSDLPWFRRVD